MQADVALGCAEPSCTNPVPCPPTPVHIFLCITLAGGAALALEQGASFGLQGDTVPWLQRASFPFKSRVHGRCVSLWL